MHSQEMTQISGVHKRSNTLTLEVHHPTPEFYYGIRWRYVGDETYRRSGGSRGVLLDYVCSTLLKFPGEAMHGHSSPLYENINAEIKGYIEEIVALYPPIAGAPEFNDHLDVHLAIFDHNSSCLRIVAGTGDEVSLGAEFGSGEGCLGFSFEKDRVLFYNSRNDNIGYYISRQELKGEIDRVGSARGLPISSKEFKSLVTIPWVDGDGSEIGGFCIGSDSDYSRLLGFFGKTEDEKKEHTSKLVLLTKTLGEVIIKIVKDREVVQ